MEIKTFTLGADPEFAIRLQGRPVGANEYFTASASLGCDGSASTGEIRPGYHQEPLSLVCKIMKIFQYGYQEFPQLEWYCGHYVDNKALGGHIHIGDKRLKDPKDLEERNYLINTIDNLEVLLENLSQVVDDQEQKRRRLNTSYGSPRAYRPQAHGIEYRTPGSWLLSPTVSLMFITLSKIAVDAAQNNLNLKRIGDKLHAIDLMQDLHTHLKAQKVEIPGDCELGIGACEKVAKDRIKFNWNLNFIGNWLEAA